VGGSWWRPDGIVELQKLLLEVVLHPMSFLTPQPSGMIAEASPDSAGGRQEVKANQILNLIGHNDQPHAEWLLFA
jgi:hypothetical protein